MRFDRNTRYAASKLAQAWSNVAADPPVHAFPRVTAGTEAAGRSPPIFVMRNAGADRDRADADITVVDVPAVRAFGVAAAGEGRYADIKVSRAIGRHMTARRSDAKAAGSREYRWLNICLVIGERSHDRRSSLSGEWSKYDPICFGLRPFGRPVCFCQRRDGASRQTATCHRSSQPRCGRPPGVVQVSRLSAHTSGAE